METTQRKSFRKNLKRSSSWQVRRQAMTFRILNLSTARWSPSRHRICWVFQIIKCLKSSLYSSQPKRRLKTIKLARLIKLMHMKRWLPRNCFLCLRKRKMIWRGRARHWSLLGGQSRILKARTLIMWLILVLLKRVKFYRARLRQI